MAKIRRSCKSSSHRSPPVVANADFEGARPMEVQHAFPMISSVGSMRVSISSGLRMLDVPARKLLSELLEIRIGVLDQEPQRSEPFLRVSGGNSSSLVEYSQGSDENERCSFFALGRFQLV